MICRLCLKRVNRKNAEALFGGEAKSEELIRLILLYFQLEMTVNDEISTVICEKCGKHLRDFHEFWIDVDAKQKTLSDADKKGAAAGEETGGNTKSELNDLLYNFTTEFIKMEDTMPSFNANGDDDDASMSAAHEMTDENYFLEETDTNAFGSLEKLHKNHDSSCKESDESNSSGDDWQNSEDNSSSEDDDDDIPLIATKKKMNRNRKYKSKFEVESDFIEIDCYICKSVFSTLSELTDHFKEKHTKHTRPFVKCCGKKFYKTEQVERHKLQHNVQCEICQKTFCRKSYLNYHIKQVHEGGGAGTDGMHECEICKTSFRSPKYLWNHMRKHDKQKKEAVCEICSKAYTTTEALRRHFRAAHEQINPYKCSRCNEKFYFKSKLDEHDNQCKQRQLLAGVVTVENNRSTNEDNCEELGEQKSNSTHSCDRCFKEFRNIHGLRRHIESVHDNVYRHVCDQCGNKFKSKKNFERHLMTHTGKSEPPAQCDICGSWLKNKESLRLHKYRHDDRDSQCRICGRKCPNRGALRRHVDRMHREEKNFKCNYCSNSFKLEISLKEHMAIHTNTQLYTCPHCSKESRSHSNMYVHIKRMHPNEWLQTKMARLNKHLVHSDNHTHTNIETGTISNKDS